MELERRSSGVAKGGLATGIVGTSLGTLALLGAGANGLGNLWNRNATQPVVVMDNAHGYGCGCGCSENQFVTRYEADLAKQLQDKDAKIAERDSMLALRDANTYMDQKTLEMYKYFDAELKDVRNELCRQAVINQKTEDSFVLAKQDLDCCCRRLEDKICDERRERKCADNTIITYTNATFYPKQVADVTVGTTTTAQTTYNPLPRDNGCCCGN